MELEIHILPSGEILIDRSIDSKVNDFLMTLLNQVVTDTDALNTFLQSGNQCEQVFGEEQLCG